MLIPEPAPETLTFTAQPIGGGWNWIRLGLVLGISTAAMMTVVGIIVVAGFRYVKNDRVVKQDSPAQIQAAVTRPFPESRLTLPAQTSPEAGKNTAPEVPKQQDLPPGKKNEVASKNRKQHQWIKQTAAHIYEGATENSLRAAFPRQTWQVTQQALKGRIKGYAIRGTEGVLIETRLFIDNKLVAVGMGDRSGNTPLWLSILDSVESTMADSLGEPTSTSLNDPEVKKGAVKSRFWVVKDMAGKEPLFYVKLVIFRDRGRPRRQGRGLETRSGGRVGLTGGHARRGHDRETIAASRSAGSRNLRQGNDAQPDEHGLARVVRVCGGVVPPRPGHPRFLRLLADSWFGVRWGTLDLGLSRSSTRSSRCFAANLDPWPIAKAKPRCSRGSAGTLVLHRRRFAVAGADLSITSFSSSAKTPACWQRRGPVRQARSAANRRTLPPSA